MRGDVRAPADKSITHRALIFSALTRGRTAIDAPGAGADNFSTADVLRRLGVSIEETQTGWVVESVGLSDLKPPDAPLDCGNSGTTIRLMAGVLAGLGLRADLVGDESLSRRPMGRVCKPLRALGADVRGLACDGKELTPIEIRPAALSGGRWEQTVASAQVKSCVLLAGLCSGRSVEVVEPHPSRDHTERMLSALGAELDTETSTQQHRVTLRTVPKSLRTLDSDVFRVPGDISSAAFWLSAGLIVPGSDVTVRHCGLNPTRTGIIDVLQDLGAGLEVTYGADAGGEPVGDVRACAQTKLGGPIDGTFVVGGPVIPRLIDELVVFGAVASQAGGCTRVVDARELRVKESDRVEETVRILRAFGAQIEGRADGYEVRGPTRLTGAHVDVSTDHRLAMTAAILACAAEGESVLEGFDIASISYPGFVADLQSLGAQVAEEA